MLPMNDKLNMQEDATKDLSSYLEQDRLVVELIADSGVDSTMYRVLGV
jgi:hypothetical protein